MTTQEEDSYKAMMEITEEQLRILKESNPFSIVDQQIKYREDLAKFYKNKMLGEESELVCTTLRKCPAIKIK